MTFKNPNLTWQPSAVTQQQRALQKNQKPCILWFTGLSGSGKSSLANAVEQQLLALNKHSYLLDGDNLRHGLNQNLGFSPQDRQENIRRVGEVARLMCDAGLIVLSAFISPYQADRDRVRAATQPGEFIEIFVDVPLAICEERDPKGLYKKARAGVITDFTGISAPYEPPLSPEIHLDNRSDHLNKGVQQVLEYLQQRGYI